jgi:hypothetical protein
VSEHGLSDFESAIAFAESVMEATTFHESSMSIAVVHQQQRHLPEVVHR